VKGEGRLPAGQAQEVAQAAQADMFVSGALLKVGEGLRLDLRVQETSSGKLLFADKVEAPNAQAVFGMVDQATAGILASLAPGEASAEPHAAASLTSNMEALHAYEEGLVYTDRLLTAEAVEAYKRAVELDPQFAMAHYQLANELTYYDFPAARQAIALAAQLAERLPIPRLQKLVIQAFQLILDSRNEEAEQVLRTAVREFPREITPRVQLAIIFLSEQRVAEETSTLEEITKLDNRSAIGYNLLGYSYGAAGDLPRALAAEDKYAALLPANDPNPIDSRGDVLAFNEHFEDALAQYRKNVGVKNFTASVLKIGLVYLHQNKYSLAEASVTPTQERGAPNEKALAVGILGAIEVGRGRLDRAEARFEESARLFSLHNPTWARWPLLWAAEIYFEQGQPEAALALGRRNSGPWAAGVRGMAQAVLNDQSAADKEFGTLHDAVTPLGGSYAADRVVRLHRILALAFAGRWQDVIAAYAQLPRDQKVTIHLAIGRAYLETGDFAKAEECLHLAANAQRYWGNEEAMASRSFLQYVLAQFYLGRVYERNGKKAEAINAYQEFLNHFESSNAKLPQIAEARAALKRLL
jgi:eukaryotic-like serine/threonine-protein kinase